MSLMRRKLVARIAVNTIWGMTFMDKASLDEGQVEHVQARG